jgi:hypothetical protein
MSGESKTDDVTLLKRVPVIVRSWDGPNSRIGLELDLGQMPWGPFDALGKRLSLLLPAEAGAPTRASAAESQLERALRHVEHAADRCAEFAQISNGNEELWLRSQETWEWIRRYLTTLWVDTEVEGRAPPVRFGGDPSSGEGEGGRGAAGPREEKDAGGDHPGNPLPAMPGAASTLKVAARALRATPLAVWRETMGPVDPDAPTREEAVQTLLGVARILDAQGEGSAVETPPLPASPGPENSPDPAPGSSTEVETAHEPPSQEKDRQDPDQVSFDFAQGYDEGYRMGRRVGLALGSRRPPDSS